MGKPQDKAMEGQLSRLLHQWQLDLERSTTLPRWRRLVINIRSAQWLLPAYSIFLARSVVDAALNATLSGRQTPLLHIASLYAAMWSVVFFASSSTECSQALASIVKVAEYVEWRGDAATKVPATADFSMGGRERGLVDSDAGH
ncbi:uncharacterized protein LOC117647456 [Thrips palmi]|uniref:Uncharacterized protein LOC117647456 n=1 Tax=Thrips palmi TaxID=161013 RepID=A0A6P8Z4Q7_THRPL|nr:uncharacterized protein LOC117647456 [Thrips palmi]